MAGIAQLVQQRTENPRITGSNLLLTIRIMCRKWPVSLSYQLVEQGTENPRITGSNPY